MDLASPDEIKWRLNMNKLTNDYIDYMRDLNPINKYNGKVIAIYGETSSMIMD
jgi:hypothetical protein